MSILGRASHTQFGMAQIQEQPDVLVSFMQVYLLLFHTFLFHLLKQRYMLDQQFKS